MTSVPPNNTSSAQTTSGASQPAISYASATKKAVSSPPVAAGSSSTSPAVAVGNATAAPQSKTASTAPANGRPSVTPAVPVVSTPVVNGNSQDHTRKASVTMNGSFVANGSSNAPKAPIQFGSLAESPAVTHSTPHVAQSTSAPIAIPSNPRVTSPAQSPSPIPQPAASGGGRPPSTIQSGGMTFGSHPGGDGDRHMRQASMGQAPLAPGVQGHDRRPSNESGLSARGGFTPQGGRGRGYSNSYQNQQFNNNHYRGPPGQGRGGMPGQFQGQGRPMPPYANSPHQPARSPALTNSVPTTPNMGQAMPMQHQPPFNPYQAQPFIPQNYGYQQPYNAMGGMPMGAPYMYPGMGFVPGMPQPQSPQPGYQQPFIPGQYNAVPQTQAMSRTSSQISERPNSSLGQPQTPSMQPSVVHSTPQASKPATPAYQRTQRKSAAIVIKNADGEVVQLPGTKPTSAAATPSAQTPPVVVSTPTPPPKSATPQHARAESKASSEAVKAFQEKVRLAAEEESAKRETAAKADEPKAVEEVKVEEKKVEEKQDTSEADAAAAAAKAKQEEDDELERQIREMEEADAAREKAEDELRAKRKAEKEAADALAAKDKLSPEDMDRKLREQEREMERLEDERAKKRAEAEAKGAGGDKAESKDDATPTTLASKLSKVTISGDSGTTTPKSDDSMGPPPKPLAGVRKPAALNLSQLNTKQVEPAQPSAALQSLKSARFLTVLDASIYPEGIQSPNPALNAAVSKKGTNFKYDKEFLLQFQKVFTEKPSLEFESKIKALIGDGTESRSGSTRGSMGGRAPSNRGGPAGAFQSMGQFGSGKTLPPGTTSQQRYEMSQGTMPRPGNPMTGSFRGTGSFPGGLPSGRVPSGMGGPNSPRGDPSRGGRQGSKRNQTREPKANAEAEKKMPLTAGMVLKPIEVTASGWKPRSVMAQTSATGAAGPAPGGAAGSHMDPEMVQRKVKAALNKMTPEKFDKIADQILAIAAQSKDEADGRTLRQVIQLTFEKATDEAHWAGMYAKFCKRMLETMSPEVRDESITDKNGNVVSGGNLFRKYLLNRCQEEFERGWKTNLPDKPEGERGQEKSEEAAMLSDEYYIEAAAKRRGLGLVQFIGELYKLGMLTERIMHECVKKLVDYTGTPDEAEIESLTKLLKTIGANLDSTEKGRPMMDVYFARIQAMMDTPELPSRLKFMLMDVVDLRSKRWASKEANKGPKTLDEVRAEAEAAAAQKAAENVRTGGGGRGGRPPMGRGDSRQFSAYGNQPPMDYTKNTVATDDLRRLTNKGANRTSSGAPMSFGPTSMFSSRSNSGRKMGPGGSLSRTGDDSNGTSRTGTPPQQKEKESVATANAFSLLNDLNDHETENPASPPSVASPELTKSSPAAAAAEEDKAEDEKKEE